MKAVSPIIIAAKPSLPNRCRAPSTAVAKATAGLAEGADQALDFSLDEVREARLVPVLDFKGRRFERQDARPADEMDGGRTQ